MDGYETDVVLEILAVDDDEEDGDDGEEDDGDDDAWGGMNREADGGSGDKVRRRLSRLLSQTRWLLLCELCYFTFLLLITFTFLCFNFCFDF